MTRPAKAGLWRWHGGALLVYGAVSAIFIWHGASLTQSVLGEGGDPFIFIWFLKWWPWAVLHHVNPLVTYKVWQPLGVPVFWVTSVPLLAALLAPVTLLFGPVVSFNLLIIAAPVVAGWCAYRLVLLVCREPAAAVIGGFLFGFSSYETAMDYATPNLSFSMLIPCMAMLAIQRLAGAVSRLRAILLASLIMVMQFMIAAEVFATMTLFGFIAWAVAFRVFQTRRADLRRLLVDVLAAGAIVLAVLAPLLILMARTADFVRLPAIWPWYITTNLGNFFIPTALTAVGGRLGAGVFPGVLQEQAGYLGLPLILIILGYARGARDARLCAYLIGLLIVFLILSLGPALWVGQKFTGAWLPWDLFLHLPLIASALPSRFMVYAALLTALIAGFWVAGGKRRWVAGVIACIALLPAPHVVTALPTAAFFRPGRVATVLGPDARLLVLPYGTRGASTYWQAESDFSYRETGGYLGFTPGPMQPFAAARELFANTEDPDFAGAVRLFCEVTGTDYIVIGPGTAAETRGRLATLHWAERRIDDVILLAVPRQTAIGPSDE